MRARHQQYDEDGLGLGVVPPSGEYLASSDDESFIFIWRQKPEAESFNIFDKDNSSDQDKETWLTFKTLRGHMEDVYDLSYT